MSVQPVLINGEWRPSTGSKTFTRINPANREVLSGEFPVSPWEEIEEALEAAHAAFKEVRDFEPERFADFLEAYAAEIETRIDDIVTAANEETALPVSPRLKDGEMVRTIDQLRQAAKAARNRAWTLPTIDTKTNIRSMLGPIGPVAVFGPNNFPLAFNSIAGGDFAAAVAAGNPVIAKGHSAHPRTTQLLAESAAHAAETTNMPKGFVQLVYRTSHEDGARLVADKRLGATGYTGARHAGLFLKEAADKGGNPIYLELSSINPVFILPNALSERLDDLVEQFVGSCLMGTGQFCTNPGLVVLRAGDQAEQFISAVAKKFEEAPAGTLLGEGVEQSLRAGIVAIQRTGAHIVTGNKPVDESRCCFANTLLRSTGKQFLEDPAGHQEEAFGNSSLLVVCDSDEEVIAVAEQLEGNLTGCIYSETNGADDALYDRLAGELRRHVGRLLNDKMPTGVAVSPAMNHGGPYPATGHPGFTAVGIPASLRRFAILECYDNVRSHRLPPALRDENTIDGLSRFVDGEWTDRSL
ncbi:aldehyde dehydrogenase (NADP(+)) [Thalassoglobus sp. JC818]|uniref:aldehyde dehydrogenase (NADP(+)) n=1 Tax=Thalassoglobus sp. JC818 TaxID=3232136 RepID=UPI003459415A